jgi:hypothetical protein
MVVALAATASPALAKRGDVPKGAPACADITGGSVSYNVDYVLGTVPTNRSAAARSFLAAASCPTVTYTLVVLDGDGGTATDDQGTVEPTGPAVEVGRASAVGDGQAELLLTADVDDDDRWVCAYVTTTSADGTVLDRAPDTGCIVDGENALGGGGGSGIYR